MTVMHQWTCLYEKEGSTEVSVHWAHHEADLAWSFIESKLGGAKVRALIPGDLSELVLCRAPGPKKRSEQQLIDLYDTNNI